MLILLIGTGSLALYQVKTTQDDLDETTGSVDRMDGEVRLAQHEQALFYTIASDVLRLAPKDPNADQVAVHFNLRRLQAAQPELLSPNAFPDMDATNAPTEESGPATNAAPVQPGQATNAAPANLPGPAGK
ncbi:MAG TPA: hypothetical protein VGZ93_13090 [Candidatus Methylacidiphilales bacterium]|jgi:hypothetical protein|nr:hypothetical protein [Candidatus Methylacidiphilales bacterium]